MRKIRPFSFTDSGFFKSSTVMITCVIQERREIFKPPLKRILVIKGVNDKIKSPLGEGRH